MQRPLLAGHQRPTALDPRHGERVGAAAAGAARLDARVQHGPGCDAARGADTRVGEVGPNSAGRVGVRVNKNG